MYTCEVVLLMLIFSVCFCLVPASQATCTVGMLGDNVPNHPLSQHIFYLHQSQFGTCYGRVHLLRFKVYSQQFYNQIPTDVYVSFWRPQTGSSSYLSIGTAVVRHNSTELVDGLCEFNVSHNNITVQPGDRMGIWMEGAALKLNFITIPSATSIVVPIEPRIRSAALSTAPEMVYFQGSANNDVVAMEVEIVPQSVNNSTTDTTSPIEKKDSSPTVLSSTLETPTTSIASSMSPTSTTTVPGLDVSTTGVPEPDVSTASVPDLVVSSTHEGEESTTGRATPEDSSVLESPALSTVSQQGNVTIGNNVGVADSGTNGELALIVAIAGGVPVIIVILLCVVVLAVMVRQWKVGGKPFRKVPAVVGDGE